MEKPSILVSCVQFAPETADYMKNLRRMESFVEEIMEARPATDLIVFPELSTTGYACTREEFAACTFAPEDDPAIRRMRALTGRFGTTVVFGLTERDLAGSGKPYNIAAVVSRGELLGIYRKIHVYDIEKKWSSQGSAYPVFDTPFGKLGLMICWDAAFPEPARIYALQGAEILAVLSNWETYQEEPIPEKAQNWELALRARAFDNYAAVVHANRVGEDRGFRFAGHSRIIDRLGRVQATADAAREEIVFAQIRMDVCSFRTEEYADILADRRPETYGLLTGQEKEEKR